MTPRPTDTTPEAHAVQQVVLARMTNERRAQVDAELAEMVAALHAAGIRDRNEMHGGSNG